MSRLPNPQSQTGYSSAANSAERSRLKLLSLVGALLAAPALFRPLKQAHNAPMPRPPFRLWGRCLFTLSLEGLRPAFDSGRLAGVHLEKRGGSWDAQRCASIEALLGSRARHRTQNLVVALGLRRPPLIGSY